MIHSKILTIATYLYVHVVVQVYKAIVCENIEFSIFSMLQKKEKGGGGCQAVPQLCFLLYCEYLGFAKRKHVKPNGR